MNQDLRNTIKSLELKLLDPETRKSKKKLDELLADDFFEFAQDGKRYNKQEIIEVLPKCPAEKIEIVDFEATELSQDCILASYIAKREILENSHQHETMCSSIWQKINGCWQMIFFQGTPTSKH